MTVTLRPLAEHDVPWLDAWLPTLLRAVGCEAIDGASLLARTRRERSLHARIASAAAAGDVALVVYAAHRSRRGAATFELVAAPPASARRGHGQQAVAAAEAEFRALGVRTAYAPAPAAHGIALYFWLRLGYHPLLRPEWPRALPGVAWLRRDLG